MTGKTKAVKLHGGFLILSVLTILATAHAGCSSSERSFGSGSAGGPSPAAGANSTAAGNGATQGGQAGVGQGECGPMDQRSCSEAGLEGTCAKGAQVCTGAGTWGPCSIVPSTDTCEKDNDDDCNGVPNENPDCQCVESATQPCSLSGLKGACAAGKQTCGANGQWGECDIQPTTDSCDTPGDDSDCDGTPNSGCTCLDGTTQPCGPEAVGECQRGTSTCSNSAWGECVGGVLPALRDCTSSDDNDCDGKPDDTLDTACTCAVDEVRACDAHPGKDGKGPCKAGQQACVLSADRGSSSWKSCAGSVGPVSNDTCAAGNDANCNGVVNENCSCIEGNTQSCGACDGGTQKCVNGQWAACSVTATTCGTCSSCGGNDACSVMPADDTRCGQISCPASDACKTYTASSITTNRCKSLSACKTKADCPFTVSPLGTSCGTAAFCDAQGNCVPRTVQCGASTCNLATQFCCMRPDAGVATCLAKGAACGDSPTPGSTNTGVPIKCDEHADCATGTGCCLAAVQGNYSLECRTKCPGGDAFGENYALCVTPTSVGPCPSGKFCSSWPELLSSPWQVCH
jgi:hypothetical protein